MNNQPPVRDERTVAVENASYRVAYLVTTFGLLVIVAVRGLVFHEALWDLLALVAVGGGLAIFYQGTRRTLSGRWALAGVTIALLGASLGIMFVMLLVRYWHPWLH